MAKEKLLEMVLKHDRNVRATAHSPQQGLLLSKVVLSKVVLFRTTQPIPAKIEMQKEKIEML